MSLPKLRYDDFYKFITSFCLVIIILSLTAGTILLDSAYKPNVSNQAKNVLTYSMWFYVAIAAIAGYFLVWALKKWKKNQDKLDAKLDAETTIKLLQVKKEAAEYEKQIDELAKEEDPLGGVSDLFKNLKRDKARKRIENQT